MIIFIVRFNQRKNDTSYMHINYADHELIILSTNTDLCMLQFLSRGE